MSFIAWKQEYAFTPDTSAVLADYDEAPAEEKAEHAPASVDEEVRYPAIVRVALPVLASAALWIAIIILMR